jgi:hypothetical protein
MATSGPAGGGIRAALTIAAFVVGVLLGALLPSGGGDADKPGPVPIGFPKTERGAADATAAYARLLSTDVLRNPAEARRALDEVLTPELAEQAVPALERSLETIAAARRRGFGPEAVSGPLAVDVLAFEGDEASVRLLSAVAVGAPTEPLRLRVTEERPELVWDGDRWRIAGGEPAETVAELSGTKAQARTFLATLGDVTP